MGEIIPSESLSRVTDMHSHKTRQPYIRSTRKNRTRKKSAVEEVPQIRPEKKNRDEPFEQLKSTESLKREKS